VESSSSIWGGESSIESVKSGSSNAAEAGDISRRRIKALGRSEKVGSLNCYTGASDDLWRRRPPAIRVYAQTV
jgi:hypothetical protein